MLERWSATKTAINTLTANYEYSHSNAENLPLPTEMQLSGKLKIFVNVFMAFLESTLILNILKQRWAL